AIPWAGISRLLCGARDEDARQIGFDEGDKPQDWQQCFVQRGIEVVHNLCRQEAVAVLQLYGQQQGTLYNG
ncbi:MAG: nucleoside deaminase, partial [Desulfuromonadales bacterium]|nr:nucleoside deaminase [Desulfuromonadales bacterium]